MKSNNISVICGTLAIAALAACTTATAEEGTDAPAPAAVEDQYVATGEPEDCISIVRITSTDVVDDKTILFKLGSKTYRNSLPNRCPSLGFEEKFSYSTSLSRLCSTDIIHVLYTAGGGLQKGAGCGLGQFQPVEKAAAQ